MNKTQALVTEWFNIWDRGDFENLPLTEDFTHSSPYGTISGKANYLALVEPNKDKFLGNRIELQDEMYGDRRAAVRYMIHNPAFSMEVSEWLYTRDGLISRVHAYYNIENEISESRKLKGLD